VPCKLCSFKVYSGLLVSSMFEQQVSVDECHHQTCDRTFLIRRQDMAYMAGPFHVTLECTQ
jgi:hypothetical protein